MYGVYRLLIIYTVHMMYLVVSVVAGADDGFHAANIMRYAFTQQIPTSGIWIIMVLGSFFRGRVKYIYVHTVIRAVGTSHSLQRLVSTASSISQLECILSF